MSKSKHLTASQVAARFTGPGNVIGIPRVFVDICGGDYTMAALLTQIVYWGERAKLPGGWVAKTTEEWHEELGLSKYQIARATESLSKLTYDEKPLVESKRSKSPFHEGRTVNFYRYNEEALGYFILNAPPRRKNTKVNKLDIGIDSEVNKLDLAPDTKVNKLDILYTESTSSESTSSESTSSLSTPAKSAGMDAREGDDDRQGSADTSADMLVDERPAKMEREAKANPMYDAIRDVLGVHGSQNGLYAGVLAGSAKRKGYAEHNTPELRECPVTPDELRAWGAEYRALHPGLSIITQPGKLVSALIEFRVRRTTAPVSAPRTDWLGFSRHDWALDFVRGALAKGATVDEMARRTGSAADDVQAIVDELQATRA